MVSHSGRGCLILRRSILRQAKKQKLLMSYYLDTWPEAVTAAQVLTAKLARDIPVVTSNPIGYGLRYVNAGVDTSQVVMTLEGMESRAASKMKLVSCYTLEKPLRGYSYSKVSDVVYEGRALAVFLNNVHDIRGMHRDDKI
jgi:hypothetical protein